MKFQEIHNDDKYADNNKRNPIIEYLNFNDFKTKECKEDKKDISHNEIINNKKNLKDEVITRDEKDYSNIAEVFSKSQFEIKKEAETLTYVNHHNNSSNIMFGSDNKCYLDELFNTTIMS